MNETNSLAGLPKDIPFAESSFQIDVIGNVTKKRYLGDFTCKIPNIKEQCLIAKHTAFLNGDMVSFLDVGTIKVHQMIAYLRYTIVQSPNFWKDSDLGYELRDPNVIQEVHQKVLTFENEWIKQIWGDLAPGTDDGDEEEQDEET